jgi:hypothetical protein
MKRIAKFVVLAAAVLAVAASVSVTEARAQQPGESRPPGQQAIDPGNETLNRYLEAYGKWGVPTPKAVDAAFARAKTTQTIDSWLAAGEVANRYADVLKVLADYYDKQYRMLQRELGSSVSPVLQASLQTSIRFDSLVLRYLTMRDEAHVAVASLYLDKGDRTHALSYALAALHSGSGSAADLVRKIIDFSDD